MLLVCPVCGFERREDDPAVRVFCEGAESDPHPEAEMKERE